MLNSLIRGAGLVAAVGIALPACGGSEKKVSGPTDDMEQAGIATLRIPRVDPELCDTGSKKVLTFDLDRDNRPDVWKLFHSAEQAGTTVQILTCKQVDFDHDGRKDYVAIYNETGDMIAEEFDLTFDGHFDARAHYDIETGKIYLEERDTGHDGKPDVWEKYEDGVLLSVKRDRNADEKPDVWEQYKEGKLVAILYDDDFDAKVDRKATTDEAQKSAAQPTAPEGTEAADGDVEDPATEGTGVTEGDESAPAEAGATGIETEVPGDTETASP